MIYSKDYFWHPNVYVPIKLVSQWSHLPLLTKDRQHDK